MEWDVDRQGVPPATSAAEQEARDKRYKKLEEHRALPGLDFLHSIMAILLPSVRHVVEAKESKKGVQFGSDDLDDSHDPAAKFRGTINLPRD